MLDLYVSATMANSGKDQPGPARHVSSLASTAKTPTQTASPVSSPEYFLTRVVYARRICPRKMENESVMVSWLCLARDVRVLMGFIDLG